MRKSLLIVTALSLLLWGVGVVVVWLGDHIRQLALGLIIGGVVLYGVAFVLFVLHFFQWLRVLKTQNIDLSGFSLFRRNEAIRPYQREAWLQAVLVFLPIPAVGIPLSFFSDPDGIITLSVYLICPLCLLLYAMLSQDFSRLEVATLSSS